MRSKNVRGSTIRRALRQLDFLPLRRETIYHLVLNPDGISAASLNRLVAADPALALALLRRAPRAVRESKLQIAQLARFATPESLLELVRLSADRVIVESSPAGLEQVWLHSLAVAHAARGLCRGRNYPHPQTAFLAGLLHNIGLLAIAALDGDAAAELLAHKPKDGLLAAEQQRFGLAHTDVANQLAKRWALPQWLHEVGWWHHESATSRPVNLADSALVEIVHEADATVAQSDFALGNNADSRGWSLPWKDGDVVAATVSRGVRQSVAFMRDHALRRSPDDSKQLIARAIDLTSQNIALRSDQDWRNAAWNGWLSRSPDCSPAELTDLVAETFAHALGALGTLCYVRDAEGASVEGTFWCDGARPITCRIEQGAGAKPHALQIVNQLRPTWQQRPHQLIDLTVGDESLAHVLVWFDEFGPTAIESLDAVKALCTGWLAHAAHVEHLEMQLSELTSSLRQQSVDAADRVEESKLAALAEMAAGAGHEINNPLAVISGRAQLLLAEESDPRRRKSLETIMAQAQRIHCMIVDLMMFARPPAPSCTPTAAKEIIQRVQEKLRSESEQRKVELRTSAADDLPQFSVDAGQLATALECIVQNALEASREGTAIQIAAEQYDGRVRLRVSDSGHGISDEQRQHIFEPFYSGRDAGRGLGMGLSKAWRIVRNHDGEIVVESSASGTTVTIELPALPTAPAERVCA